MSATKEAKETKETKAADLAALLGTETMSLAELRSAVDDLTLARAWANGDIEFGRRSY